MTAVLNIGLLIDATGETLKASHAIRAARQHGARIGASSLHVSASEPTLVLTLRKPMGRAALATLSAALQQDCIAQWDGVRGRLEGAKAAEWGPFDPAFFLLPSGHRLSEGEAAA